MADDSTTYGPSEERRTRTPIKFKKNIESDGKSGMGGLLRINPPNLLDKITSQFSGGYQPQIEIDPTAVNNVGQDIRHEAIHALLNGVNLSSINSSLPAYAEVAKRFPQSGYGDPSTEIPSYAATGESSMLPTPIPSQFIDNYIEQLKGALQKVNPQLVQKYSSIANESRALNGNQGQQ